ncbi:SHQ1 protein-domain-containing protein [Lentinula guzmanii]|uniref:SHQ1 protein-domain-containing protein n=1 Tax=Lentinula guzmanii TaxID=2804957 RepID=A0AA38MRA7_9AGAR|nr:SHQ1 protein-domain-containing protein [Lentinula guzmanii]
MITPRFSCSQTAESVIISVYCPSVRASDVEINVDGNLFSLHINPYFLRLNFTNSLIEDDASSAQYDPSTGYLNVKLTKEIKGQEFKDLDLLAKLLAPRPTVHEPMIEVISSESTAEDPDQLVTETQNLSLHEHEILEAANNDWQLPQEVPPPEQPTLRVNAQYGFLDLYSGYFTNVAYTENEVNELGSEAETLTLLERRQRRIKHEDEKWDEEYYVADFADDEYIRELILWNHPHLSDSGTTFTEKENVTMLNLPRKEYIPTGPQTRSLYLTLTTVLFSYAYDARTTQHDPTPESAWTICSLTPSFSALDPPPYHSESNINLELSSDEISATFVPSYRRSLAFPLYRSFALAEKCREDVAHFLLRGRRTVFRCLMEMKDILDHHDVYYVYSKVWLDDLCVWTQAYASVTEMFSDETLTRLGNAVKDASITKASVGWELEQLEVAIQNQASEEREVDSDDE